MSGKKVLHEIGLIVSQGFSIGQVTLLHPKQQYRELRTDLFYTQSTCTVYQFIRNELLLSYAKSPLINRLLACTTVHCTLSTVLPKR